ncbi:hypothetical protein Tco_0712370 [Tanacetum coccineum]
MIRSWPGTVVRCRDIWVGPIVNAPAGRLLGAYDLEVATPRAMVHAGDKTSRDASACHAALAVLHDALRALVDMLLIAMLIEDMPLVVMFACHAALAVLHDALRALVDMLWVAMLIEDVPLVAQLVDTNTKSELEEAPSEAEEALSEAEESQPLGSIVPLMSEEFEASKLSYTRTISSHSSASSDSTAPLSPDHLPTHVSPTPTPTRVLFHRRTARMARYRSYYETPSPSSSLTLPVRKRYRGTSELIEETEGESSKLDYEREGSEDESFVTPPKIQQRSGIPHGVLLHNTQR